MNTRTIILKEARRLPHLGLYHYMKDVGLSAIKVNLLNHGKARPVHGIPYIFHIA